MRKLDILKNVGSSWVSLGVNIVIGFFLSPFILHRLGDAAYGIWVLIFSVTGYYGIFDLGIRSSVIRYISKLTAVEDKEGLAKFFNTSLATYTFIGLATTVATVITSRYVGSMFKIDPSFLATAHWLFLIVGLSVAIGFPLGIFAGMLEGLQRFYLLNFTNVISLVLRGILTVMVFAQRLWSAHGWANYGSPSLTKFRSTRCPCLPNSSHPDRMEVCGPFGFFGNG